MSIDQTQKLISDLNDSRLVNMSEHLLYPLLSKHVEQKIELMCGKFKNGQKDFIAEVAEISYIKDLMVELRGIQTKGNKARAKLETP